MKNILNKDFQDFLMALNEFNVRYIVVGGYAVIFHGYHRSTGDLDIWIERNEENYNHLLQAFQSFGLALFDMNRQNFLNNASIDVFTFGVPPVQIDLMLEVKGLTFEAAYTQSIINEIDNIPIRYLDLRTLKEAKKHSGRHKDLDDLEHL